MKRIKLYGLLVLAFFMKDAGAAWDASYHFKYLRDLTQTPHILNVVGNILLLFLFIYMWRTEPKQERRPLKVLLFGIMVFLAAIVLDDQYHRFFGIDLTTWSPAHFMLYLGTFITIIGSVLLVENDYRRGLAEDTTRRTVLLVLFCLLLSDTWFPLLQQEQGVIAEYLMKIGRSIASPELLAVATTKAIYGGIPAWLYTAYAGFSCLFIFRLLKSFQLSRFSATIVSVIYLVFRIIMNTIFAHTAYQTSALPYFLPIAGLLFDLSFNYFSSFKPNWLKMFIVCVLTILTIHAFSLIEALPPTHPPMPQAFIWLSLLWAFAGFGLAIGLEKILKKQIKPL